MKTEKIPVKTILNYLPDSLLESLSLDFNIDKQVKKLEGKIMFKLLLYGVLSSSQLSLNVLISLFDKLGFRSLIGVDNDFTTKRNSLADRLIALDSSYFEAIFEHSVKIFSKHLPAHQINGYSVRSFDSTLVACSAKLLDFGIQTGRKSKDETCRYKFLKFTVGFNGQIPVKVKFYDKQPDLNDANALRETIREMSCSPKDVVIFDRGLQTRKVFDEFSVENRLFVCRINPTKKFKVIENRPITPKCQTDRLVIETEQIVRLYNDANQLTKQSFRLIAAHKIDEPSEKLYFITNILDDLSVIEITEIYRLRWEIERFFRFIKQNLNFSHFLSRNYNAIKNMAYVMLIAAMFIALFNKLNNRKGFKISKLAFLNELEIELVKELIIQCNGDLNLINKYVT